MAYTTDDDSGAGKRLPLDEVVDVEFNGSTHDLIIRRKSPLFPDSDIAELQRTRVYLSSYRSNVFIPPDITSYQYLINEEDGWELKVYSPPKKDASLASTVLNLFIFGSLGAVAGYVASNSVAMALGASLGATIGFLVPERQRLWNAISKVLFESKHGLKGHESSDYRKDRLYTTNIKRQTGGSIPVDNQVRVNLGFRETYKRVFPMEYLIGLEQELVRLSSGIRDKKIHDMIFDDDGSMLALSLTETFVLTRRDERLKIRTGGLFEGDSKGLQDIIDAKLFAYGNRLSSTTIIHLGDYIDEDFRGQQNHVALVQLENTQRDYDTYLIGFSGGEYSLMKLI